MNKINHDIRENYDFFQELLTLEKQILAESIYLEPKRNNVRWLSGYSIVQHESISDEVTLLIERSKRDSKYGIKLRCSSLSREPFVRFDSDGPAHRNGILDVPLEEQTITTPHFNSFDKNGVPIAYKNTALMNENQSKLIAEDLSFGISLFCMETNSKLSNGDFPEVIDRSPELDLTELDEMNFDNIEFD